MSGDVQPRKRKDKRKKKDDLTIEEPRGTAATLGEGDVFMHSQHDHGTGGHWCAKIIFFSLLAVLVSLIGLIILENRGLTELEANSVESRYSNVLEGWIEEGHDNDHHDEHTLELKHPDLHTPYYHNTDPQTSVDDKSEKNELDHREEKDDADDNHEDDDTDLADQENNDDEDEYNSEEDDDDGGNDKEYYDDNHDNDIEDDDDGHDNDMEEDDEDDHDNNIEDDDNDHNNDIEDDDNDNHDNDIEDHDAYDDDASDTEDQDANNIDQNNEDWSEKYEESNEYDEDNNAKKTSLDSEENETTEDLTNEKKYLNYEEIKAPPEEEDSEEDKEDAYDYKYYNKKDAEGNFDSDRYNFQRDYKTDKELKKIYENGNTVSIEEHDSVEDYKNYYNTEKKNDDEEEHEHEEDEDVDVERIEKEVTDEDNISVETPTPVYNNEDASIANEEDNVSEEDDKDFLDAIEDGDDEPPIEIITAPSGAAFDEIEVDVQIIKPPDTLVDEEEYEKKQEELRREESETSHMWLKLVVGGALLVATHAVLRRFTAPRDEPEEEEVVAPLGGRRMTLIENEMIPKTSKESDEDDSTHLEVQEKEIFQKPELKKNVEFNITQKMGTKEVNIKKDIPKEEVYLKEENKDKELYSDEEEIEEDEEQEEEIESKHIDLPVLKNKNVKPEPDQTEEDVEVADEELIEEEITEEEDEEEEISDVDDTELLSRLEAKYGRLPEPERPGKQKGGGNSFDDIWPGEPGEPKWRRELDDAEGELRQGDWRACERRVSAAALAGSGRARWLAARALDVGAEQERDNRLLSRAINAYIHLLKLSERLSDKQLLDVAQRAINRIQFRGTYLSAEPVYKTLIRRFPNDVNYRNNLTVSCLMANRPDLADEVLKETLQLWPNDRVALAHYGFVLKNHYKKLEEAIIALQKALDGDSGPANEARFYYHLGDALLQLGRSDEALEVHKRGTALGHFLSPTQRSLYNVDRLKSRPWWDIEDTPYVNLAKALEKSWRDILKEGEAAKELFEKEKEGLKEKGDWSQLDIFVQGRELPGRCKRAPVTCAIVKDEARAAGCRRGQVKFSAMAAGTHVRAHVGPTNCRLRMHLGLSNTKHTYIRVDNQTRQWRTGKVFMFDDSFEHEVWHNGTGSRLVLIVDVWHPDLSAAERKQLPPI